MKQAIDFAVWYSGMSRDKVEKAYLRYQKEVKQLEEEPYTCQLKGGKDACNFKSKDFIACVLLRNCKHAKIA